MQVVSVKDKVYIAISGPVRLGETLELHALCVSAIDTGLDATIELAQAEHLHAAALQVLRAFEARLSALGRRFNVRAPSPQAMTALRLCGLTRWLADSEEQP